jgi:hypothetical protein
LPPSSFAATCSGEKELKSSRKAYDTASLDALSEALWLCVLPVFFFCRKLRHLSIVEKT